MYNRLALELEVNSETYEGLNFIRGAKVPIIKFIEVGTNINFDLSFNKLDGVNQLKEVDKGLDIYPEMRYLIFVLKCMLKSRDLHETYTGGIGSFLLFCMILAFLRELRAQYVREGKKQAINNITLGEYLIKLFEFYGMKTDWSKKRIIMHDGGYLEDKNPQDPTFSLISPQDIDHDIGAAAFKMRDVLSVFKNRYLFMVNYNFGKQESMLKYIVNPSDQIFAFIKDE